MARSFWQSLAEPCMFVKGTLTLLIYLDSCITLCSQDGPITDFIRSMQNNDVLTRDQSRWISFFGIGQAILFSFVYPFVHQYCVSFTKGDYLKLFGFGCSGRATLLGRQVHGVGKPGAATFHRLLVKGLSLETSLRSTTTKSYSFPKNEAKYIALLTTLHDVIYIMQLLKNSSP
jgi:hypothetical protein